MAVGEGYTGNPIPQLSVYVSRCRSDGAGEGVQRQGVAEGCQGRRGFAPSSASVLPMPTPSSRAWKPGGAKFLAEEKEKLVGKDRRTEATGADAKAIEAAERR